MIPRFGSAFGGADLGGHCRNDLEQVTDDPKRGDLEDRRVRIAIDRHNEVGAVHPHVMLNRAADTHGDVETWRYRPSGLADLLMMRPPSSIDDGTSGPHRRTECLR